SASSRTILRRIFALTPTAYKFLEISTVLFMLELEQCVEHVYCEQGMESYFLKEKFKYFVTYLRQNCINSKCNA
ncbi:hypothetical protein ALC57_05002, partial [Trachymyrmex cornetzi]